MRTNHTDRAILGLLFTSLVLGTASQQAGAQVFSDNFTTDTSLGSEWFNMYNTTEAGMTLNPTTGQGLALDVSSGTGKTDEVFGQFSSTPVSLMTPGDSITLTVGFNSPNLSGNTGSLLVGLYNDGGNPATGNLSGTATGGATAAYTGYFGLMGLNTSAGTSTKFYSRQGGASDANELGYYSSMTTGSYTQLGSFAASGNANLANSTAYVLTYTITLGVGTETLAEVISQGGTALDNWTFTDTTGAYNSFDELDFGAYGKNDPLDLNVTGVEVTDSIAAVPEPSSFGLIGAGLLALLFRRRLIQG